MKWRAISSSSIRCLSQCWLEGIVRDLNDSINVGMRNAEQTGFQRRGDRDRLRLTEPHNPLQCCENIFTHYLIRLGCMEGKHVDVIRSQALQTCF